MDLVKLVGSYDLDANANRKNNRAELEVLGEMERSPDDITSDRLCFPLLRGSLDAAIEIVRRPPANKKCPRQRPVVVFSPRSADSCGRRARYILRSVNTNLLN